MRFTFSIITFMLCVLSFVGGMMSQKYQCKMHPSECRPTVLEHMDWDAQLRAEQAAAMVELKQLCATPTTTAARVP